MNLPLLLTLFSASLSFIDAKTCTNGSVRIYQFEHFTNGVVYFKNGTKTGAPLNYNYSLGAVQFLDARKDTLLIIRQELVDRIVIGDKIYYSDYRSGEGEMIASSGAVRLVRKTRPATEESQQHYSSQNFRSDPDANVPSSLLISNQTNEFQWQNTAFRHGKKFRSVYYLMDANRIFHPAKRKSFLKIYAKQRTLLTEYFAQNRIDFKNEHDLIRLLAFCEGRINEK